jgi:thiol-disulfide isomerase/thioredoxin
MIPFIKKHWQNLLIVIFIGLLVIPQTSIPIKVFFQRLVMSTPSEMDISERKKLSGYDWQLTETDGSVVQFSNSKDKVILLNLWATWCPPCLAELPSMQNLYNIYGDKVDFYFVSSEDAETVRKFMEKKGYDFPVYLETRRPPTELQVTIIPTTFLIDRNGEIVIEKTGAARWDSDEVRSSIDELLQSDQ